jgi:prepilin-type N-terminal cleavage/methylation domain-containing protein
MRHARPTPARAGVTLIELLVVMMIIAILAALSLSAVFSVRESQMKSFTETLVNKLASALDGQWKAAVDQIREEPVPPAFVALAGNDPQRARVIYTKARLVQEFPVTFDQARRPFPYPIPANPAQDILQPKPAYVSLPASAGNQTFEASALLYLSLNQGRRGQAGFNADEHIEPSAIQTQGNLKIFVDSWGAPLRYCAFPYYNDELNNPPYYDTSKPQNQQSPDPQDPEQSLRFFVQQYPTGAATFVSNVHPLDQVTVGGRPQALLRNLIPVVMSAGRDGDFGHELTGSPAQPTRAAVLWMKLTRAEQNDNIYSYRLRRSGARGD